MPLLQRTVAPEGSDCMNTVWVDERNMLQLVVHRTSMQRSGQRRILISLDDLVSAMELKRPDFEARGVESGNKKKS